MVIIWGDDMVSDDLKNKINTTNFFTESEKNEILGNCPSKNDTQYHYKVQLVGMSGLVAISVIAIGVGLITNNQGITAIGAASVGGIAGYLAPKPN